MLNELLARLPDSNGTVVVLSGGMDSTIAMRLAVAKYGNDKVAAITFDYGQRQRAEIEFARRSTLALGVKHLVAPLGILGEIGQGFSANCDPSLKMPTIRDVLGNPRPPTYVPNRNMILMAVAAAYAEVNLLDNVLCGLQVHDAYGYHDTTQAWVNDMNTLLAHNRIQKINIFAPFSELSKTDELQALLELDGNLDLLKHTLTCYDPIVDTRRNPVRAVACGKCPTCAERIQAFKNIGQVDPCEYSINIAW